MAYTDGFDVTPKLLEPERSGSDPVGGGEVAPSELSSA